ncbi:MAG: hypothetical protein PHN31_00905 [Candidatus Gracilibacteria bacterium]|nr:hypothetical protein [Candidatus Gracilibacteria bacterium]
MKSETLAYIPKQTIIIKDGEKIFFEEDFPIELTKELVKLIIEIKENTPLIQQYPTIVTDIEIDGENNTYEIRADTFKLAN